MTKQIIRGQQARKVAGKAAGDSRQLKKRKEFVRVHEREIVRCVCGNEPYRFGFWPCDDFGKVINPINSRSVTTIRLTSVTCAAA